MLRIIRGNRALQFRDGVMAKSKRGAEMIVRTATDAVTNAICVALFYELCKASDQWIGGRQYQEFWQHEAMISTLTFLATSAFAWVYKCAHPNSK